MKLAIEETKIMVTGRSSYRKNNLKFKGRNRNRNHEKKNWEPEPEPRQNGTIPHTGFQHEIVFSRKNMKVTYRYIFKISRPVSTWSLDIGKAF
jgi:hypothetical protein